MLAIALPYTGIFAKVFAEQMEEADQRPSRALPPGTDALSRFLYARAPLMLHAMWSYTLYRLECALRSSAVLGFIGLPTLGFQLDAFFRVGDYGAASAIMLLYIWPDRLDPPVDAPAAGGALGAGLGRHAGDDEDPADGGRRAVAVPVAGHRARRRCGMAKGWRRCGTGWCRWSATRCCRACSRRW